MDFLFTPVAYAAYTAMSASAGVGAVTLYKKAQKKANDKYDLVVTINSLIDLPVKGWPISYPVYETLQLEMEKEAASKNTKNRGTFGGWFSIGSNEEMQKTETPALATPESLKEPLPAKKAAVSAVLGLYNRGKSYLLARVFGLNLESSYFSHTEGFSAVLSRSAMTETLVGLDTKGSQKPVIGCKKESITDAEATERFLQCLAFELSDVVIVVVNRLTRDDQSYILQLKDMREKSVKAKKPELIVVHNLTHVRDLKHMDQIIEEEIVKDCETELAVKDNPFWAHADGTRHVVMAMDESEKGSEAGQTYNARTISLLQSWLSSSASTSLKSVNLIDRIVHFTNERIGNFLNKQLKVIGQQQSDGRYSSILMAADPKIKINEIEYQDMRFNLVGIIERPSSMEKTHSKAKARVVSDSERYYITVDCSGFREENIEAQIQDEKTIYISGVRPADQNLPEEHTVVATDFNTEEPDKIDWICTLPGPIQMEPPEECYIMDGVFYVTCKRRAIGIKVVPKKK